METEAVRGRVLGQLSNIDPQIAERVANGLGEQGPIQPASTTKQTRTDLKPSPALGILAKAKPTFDGRVMGCLVSDGADGSMVEALRAAVKAAGGELKVLAPKIGGVTGNGGQPIAADFQLTGGPSVLFDAVAVVVGPPGVAGLVQQAAAVAFVHDAFAYLKVIGYTEAAVDLLRQAGVKQGETGVVALNQGAAERLVQAAQHGRIWSREKAVRPVI